MTPEIDRLNDLIRQLEAMATTLKDEVNALCDVEINRVLKRLKKRNCKGPDIPEDIVDADSGHSRSGQAETATPRRRVK